MPEHKDKGQQEQLTKEQKILAELLKLPENKECADCGAKGPRWTSSNLGVFICIKCAGIHRSLGTHISKVKSATLDKWTPAQVEVMERIGNGKARELYEYSLPENFRRPNDSDGYALEQFIRAKYDRKEYMARDTKEEQSKKDAARLSKTTTKKPTTGKPIMEIKETVQVTKTTKIMDNGPDLIALNESEVSRPSDPQFSVFQSATTTVTSTSFVSASPSSMFPPSSSSTTVKTTSQTDFGPFFSGGNEAQSVSKASILQLYNTPLTQSSTPTNTTTAPSPSATATSASKMAPNYDVVLTAPKQPVPPKPVYGVPQYGNTGYMQTAPSYVNPAFASSTINNPNMRPVQMPMMPGQMMPTQMPVQMTGQMPMMPGQMPVMNTTGYVNPNFAAKMNPTGKFM